MGKSFCKLRDNQVDETTIDNKSMRKLKSIRLLKMRDPWGEETWTGDWSRFSFAWTTLSGDLQAKLNGSTKSSGQFYISFEDFLKHFDELYLVHTNLNAFAHAPLTHHHKSLDNEWACVQFYGSWKSEDSSAAG